MKTLRKLFSALTLLCCLFAFSSLAADIDRLQGTWTIKKKNAEGVEYKQEIEFKDSTFTFKVLSLEDKVVLYAKGKVSTDKAGNLKIIKFSDIYGGASAENLEPVYDDRAGVYRMGYNSFTIAMNFDGYRDEDPTVDVYKKVTK